MHEQISTTASVTTSSPYSVLGQIDISGVVAGERRAVDEARARQDQAIAAEDDAIDEVGRGVGARRRERGEDVAEGERRLLARGAGLEAALGVDGESSPPDSLVASSTRAPG